MSVVYNMTYFLNFVDLFKSLSFCLGFQWINKHQNDIFLKTFNFEPITNLIETPYLD